MIRKLVSLIIVLALGGVLVSPCVDGDDAVHHRPHHHHLSLLRLQADSALLVETDFDDAAPPPVSSCLAKPAAPALRC
jgi:hypothetical protein